MLSLPRTATGLERHLYTPTITRFSQAKKAAPQNPPSVLHGSSGKEECTGDHIGCFSPDWLVGGFSETQGSVNLSLVTQPARNYGSGRPA